MGKAKRQKRTPRKDPLARDSDKDEKTRQEKIQPLLKNLKSAKPAERAMAIGAINALAEDPKLRMLLLKDKVVHAVLSHTLTDSSSEIASEGYGFLRNIVLEEGRDIALFLFRQNILVSLNSVLGKLSQLWQNTLPSLEGQDRETAFEFVENVFGLISSMAMADDLIYDAVTTKVAEPALALAVQVLKGDNSSVIESALELLYVLSEENPEIIANVLETVGGLDALNPALSSSVTSKVYYLGILFNLQAGTDKPLLPILEELAGVVSSLELDQLAAPVMDGVTDPEELKIISKKAVTARAQVNAAQVTFEIFAAAAEVLTEFPEEDAVLFLKNTAVGLALQAVGRPEFTFRATSAINNFGWLFVALEVSWNHTAESVWTKLAPIAVGEDADAAAAALGALGAVAKQLQGAVPLDEAMAASLLATCSSLRTEESKESWIQYAQALIVLLAIVGQTSGNTSIISPLRDLILSVLESPADVPPELVLEAIDNLFDVFGDNDAAFNQALYVDAGVNQRLKNAQPLLKRTLKSIDKSKSPALREQADEALLNLAQFIDYKA